MSTDAAPMKGARFLRTVSRQQDNAEEDDEIDALDSQEEERMVAVKNLKPSARYKNNPLLRPAAEVLAAAQKADNALLARVRQDKTLQSIFKQIEQTSGAERRIKNWLEQKKTPEQIASMFRKDYPTLSIQGAEWKSLRLYTALFMRQHHLLNPTVKLG
ncbi:hypothetical protein F443_01279 [Phytophthora nicotianae P1569]|uniref:RxLR effector protein n=1 Tax=Phytophthora nicotianae P1569 TaxID=1317065 RepID=V9FX91_PHYNI|nr:hypothetical protein F443_01279 [Phytophthora nicotianae P1569]